MTGLASWTIPRKHWRLKTPATIAGYQEVLDKHKSGEIIVSPDAIEEVEQCMSNIVNFDKVDISEIKEVNSIGIVSSSLEELISTSWYNNYLWPINEDRIIFELNREIQSFLSSDAVFKIKVEKAYFISDKDNNMYFRYLASVEVIDTADNLTLLKLSLE